ncbi:unnamed protein product [Orchesella dallaii]|uniref:C2H2-type domain-containing protein n=1 Tax=Orchesella dallaii TaxID=48710 RepID=A0ABP1QJB2_9HEXA
MDSDMESPRELPQQGEDLGGGGEAVTHGEISGGKGKVDANPLDGEGLRFPFELPFKVPLIEEMEDLEDHNFYSTFRIRDFSKEQGSDEEDVGVEQTGQEQGVSNDDSQEVENEAGSDNRDIEPEDIDNPNHVKGPEGISNENGEQDEDVGVMEEETREDEPRIDDACNMEIVGESEETPEIVEYCLVCANIANYYDKGGVLIKRKVPTHDYSHEKLYACFCELMGIPENFELATWDFETEGFPFCKVCEDTLIVPLMIETDPESTVTSIIDNMAQAEEKYVLHDLYTQHDCRYYVVRKYILGDLFRGEIRDQDSDGEVNGNDLNENAETGENPTFILPTTPPRPFEYDVQGKQNECLEDDQRSEIQLPVTASESETNNDDVNVVSTNSSNDMHNDENIPPIMSIEKQSPKEVLKIPGFSMTLRGRSRTNVLNATPPSSILSGESASTNAASNSIQSITQVNNEHMTEDPKPASRKRGRPRKNSYEITKRTKNTLSSFNDISNLTETKETSTVGMRKRGRPRKSSDAILNKKTTTTDENSCKTQGDENVVGRKRGRPRETKLEIVEKNQNSQMNSVKENTPTSIYNNDVENSASDMYSDKVRIEPDPLCGNIYYRNLLFVRLEGNSGFQCSTCAERINNGKYLQQKFFNHYLARHTDCYKCPYCVVDNQFNSTFELQHHFQIAHPNSPHDCIEVGRRRGKSSINHTNPPSEKRLNRTPCAICGNPLQSMTDSEVSEHRISHLSIEERNQLQTEAAREHLPATTKRGRKKRINNQAVNDCGRSDVAPSHCVIGSSNQSVPINTIESQVSTQTVNGCGRSDVAPSHGVTGSCNQSVPINTIESQVSTETREFKCDLCGTMLVSELSVKNHLKIHNGCKYPDCEKSFVSPEELRSHIDMEHFFINPCYEYHCRFCGAVSINRFEARQHSKTVGCKKGKKEISDMLKNLVGFF